MLADIDLEERICREFWLPWQAENTNRSLELPAPSGPDHMTTDHFTVQLKILIVDDNGLTREVVREYLRSKGYLTFEASNVRETMAKIDEADLVMLDMTLSGEDGMTVLNQVRKHADSAMRALPIIAVSPMKEPGDREVFLSAGASECLRKPLDLEELDRILSRQQENFR